ncbi:uncharacterized protein LOC142550147 [Primulina tabacum]|uniref:uncharacterized protein LOC142550147 n=1 Tax=Primulina tabacum TaxID=48773 RepID=UPI003F59AC4C
MLVNPDKISDGILCNFCQKVTKSGISRLKQHFAEGFKNTRPCPKASACVKQEMKDHFEEKLAQKTVMDSIPHFDDVFDIEDQGDDIDLHGDPSSRENGIAFNAVKYDSFKPMIEAIGQYGPGMKPPSYHEVREPLLKEEINHTKLILKQNEEEMAKKGCTLMADGWRDRNGRSLINFLVNTPKDNMFIESVDASSYSHTCEKMFELLDKFVQKVGADNIVQVVTDSASNNVYAGKKLMDKYPNFVLGPLCSTLFGFDV